MIYAGVDVAKVDHVIGAVDERGEEQGKRMPFKNSAAGFERCEAWLEGVPTVLPSSSPRARAFPVHFQQQSSAPHALTPAPLAYSRPSGSASSPCAQMTRTRLYSPPSFSLV